MKKPNILCILSELCTFKTLLTMKLAALLFALATFQSIGNSYSQTMEVTLDLKNAPVAQVFQEIEKQSNIRFLYINDAVRDKIATLNVRKENIDKVLDKMLADIDMKYTILENNLIVITPISMDSKQGITVKGTVTATTTGESLPGVNVLEKGTMNGAVTDMDGNYTITVSGSDAVLVFSSVGYTQEEVTVGNQTTINMTLVESIEALEEVVVIGYGTSLKKDVTTSIAKVDPSGIPNAANSGVDDLLFGKAAGVQVRQYSAQPGGQVDLSIRGRGNPLIVIDGIVVSTDALESGVNHAEINNVRRGNLGGINPNDVESIEILKDASAAIYGVNAGNGVILITTKKGKEGRLNISYNGSRSFSYNYPYLEPLEAREFMETYNRLAMDMHLADNNMQPFGPNPVSGFPAGYFSDSAINNNMINTDWVGQILRNGSVDNHNLNVSGGTEKITYYFSGGYYNQIGTVINSDMDKYNGMFDLSFKPSKTFTISASAIGSRSNFNNSVAGWQTGGGGGNAYTALQAALAYPTYLPVRDPVTGEYTQYGIIGNPVAQLDIKDKTENSNLLVKTSLDVHFIPGILSGRVLFGNNYEESLRDFFIPSTINWFDDYRARASIQQAKRQKLTFETYLTFTKSFRDILNIDIVAGYGEYINSEYGFGVQAFDMLDVINTDRINGAPTNGNSYRTRDKQRSYFTRGTFDLYDRYIVTAAWRYDGYSQFFPESKYASFPSVSVGWKITNESFMSEQSLFDLLKLRASYGTTGRNLPSGVAYGLYSSDDDIIPFADGSVMYVPYLLTQIDHPSLTWEKTIMKNIGLDFEIMQSRVSGSIEWFQDDRTNLLRYGDNAANTPALSMIPTQPVNGGHQVRKGIDASIEGDILRDQNLMWNMLINISHYSYKWKERFKEDDVTSYLNVDDPVNAIYAFETNGILQIGDAVPVYQPATAQTAGSPIFVDQNGDEVLDSADVKVYDQTPKISIGFNNTFRYRNFDFSVYLYAYLGMYRQNYSLNWANARNFVAGSTGGAQNASKDILDAWTTENPGGTLPGSTYNEYTLGNIGNTIGWGSDYTITRANFLRVRNITLGYTIHSKSLSRYFQTLRFYADVQNAFIITKYKGADPEIESPAVKGGAAPYPMARTISLGINLNF